MKSYFVCRECGKIILKKNTERHYKHRELCDLSLKELDEEDENAIEVYVFPEECYSHAL